MIFSLATVYTGAGQTGRSRLFGVPFDERARTFDAFQMFGAQLHRQIRSVSVPSSSTCDTRLFLFSSPFSPLWSFQGEFVQIVNRQNSGVRLDVDLADHGFDRRATSLVVMSTRREWDEGVQSANGEFTTTWTDAVAAALDGSRATAVGGPVFRWLPGATGWAITGTQRLSVRAAGKDYDASFTLTIALGLSGSQPTAAITDSRVWVESGAKSGRVRRGLDEAISDAVPDINDTLATTVTSPFPLDELYLLPGAQQILPQTGVFSGSTSDDVTIVGDAAIV